MARIEGEIVVSRPVDVVFDYVADQRNEPQYNPRMVRADKVTPGPVGQGTRFRSAVRSMGRDADMLIEFTGYDRPARLASTTTMRQAVTTGALTFEPVPAGTRMRWSWQLEPRGFLKLMTPLVARMGDRQEQENWTNLKHFLEEQKSPVPSPEDAAGAQA